MSKIYWSNIDPIGDDTPQYNMTYFLIPHKWWSIKEWKLAFSFRKNFYLTGMIAYKNKDKLNKGR